MTDELETKDCGCSVRSIKCEHFEDDGSSLQVLHFPEEWKAFLVERGVPATTYCIQYTPVDAGPLCTGDDFDDEVQALETFGKLAELCRSNPVRRHLLGAFVFVISGEAPA